MDLENVPPSKTLRPFRTCLGGLPVFDEKRQHSARSRVSDSHRYRRRLLICGGCAAEDEDGTGSGGWGCGEDRVNEMIILAVNPGAIY